MLIAYLHCESLRVASVRIGFVASHDGIATPSLDALTADLYPPFILSNIFQHNGSTTGVEIFQAGGE